MSIKDFGKKIKPYWSFQVLPVINRIKASLDIKDDIFIALVIILIGLAGFGLGKLSALEKGREPVTIKPAQFTAISASSTNTGSISGSSASVLGRQENTGRVLGLLVAAKGGTKYYFPSCSGASRISEKNKIWFNSYAEAQSAGYSAAANCVGLK